MSPNQIATSSQEFYGLVKISFLCLWDPLGQCFTAFPLERVCVLWPPSTFPICEMLPILVPIQHWGCPLLRKQPSYVLIIAGFIYATTFPSSLYILTHLILMRTLCGEFYYYHPHFTDVKMVA